ncbi:MAG: AAA domain-containing protein [Planctomycetaceae bacterium]|nr:AAA domain-containing protein [Planctomycetaceae bacterium]
MAEGGAFLARVVDEVERVLVGQRPLIDSLLIGLLTGGHVLLEGLPGLAKTLAVESLAKALGGEFRRIQFTPDLLPADLLGGEVFDGRTGTWTLREGPVFANFVLADEINRAPAKVQSALLEAMQERHVSLAGTTRPLPEPFLVLATQNPIEQEGTYPLPEAQVDRFLLKVLVHYPGRAQEREILSRIALAPEVHVVRAVAGPKDVLAARKLLDAVYVDPKVTEYVLDLVAATRDPASCGLAELTPYVLYGASPRGSIGLVRAARAKALLDGRAFTTPQDVKSVAPEVLRHRVVATWEAEAEGVSAETIVAQVLDAVRVP